MVAYVFPPTALLPKVIQKLQSQTCRIILIAPGWPTKPWLWDLVEMSLDIPCQRNIPEPPCLVSRSSALQEHGFTAEVAERIAAPQRISTRSIYTSKWTVFQRWCTEKQVDFKSPSIRDICNFFWYLFNDLNRCPSTIEGYRTAIADTLGNTKKNIITNPEIARLIASFHRDKPRSSSSIPKWNLPLVLQRLTQPPFEPQEEAALKFLT